MLHVRLTRGTGGSPDHRDRRAPEVAEVLGIGLDHAAFTGVLSAQSGAGGSALAGGGSCSSAACLTVR